MATLNSNFVSRFYFNGEPVLNVVGIRPIGEGAPYYRMPKAVLDHIVASEMRVDLFSPIPTDPNIGHRINYQTERWHLYTSSQQVRVTMHVGLGGKVELSHAWSANGSSSSPSSFNSFLHTNYPRPTWKETFSPMGLNAWLTQTRALEFACQYFLPASEYEYVIEEVPATPVDQPAPAEDVVAVPADPAEGTTETEPTPQGVENIDYIVIDRKQMTIGGHVWPELFPTVSPEAIAHGSTPLSKRDISVLTEWMLLDQCLPADMRLCGLDLQIMALMVYGWTSLSPIKAVRRRWKVKSGEVRHGKTYYFDYEKGRGYTSTDQSYILSRYISHCIHWIKLAEDIQEFLTWFGKHLPQVRFDLIRQADRIGIPIKSL